VGLFSGIGKAIQKTGKGISKGVSGAIKTGATGPFEYLTLKPLEAVAPSVLNFAQRGKSLLGTASQVQQVAQQAVAENQGLLNMIPGASGLGGLFGGAPAAPEPMSGNFSQPAAPAVPVWVWLAAAGVGVLGLVLFLRKKS